MRIITFIMVILLAIPHLTYASRVKEYSLSDCINKADVIIIVFFNSVEDIKDKGVLKIKVLTLLKGHLEKQEIFIASYSQHSKSGIGPEGPIKAKPKEGYIFFLNSKPNDEDQYLMFDEHDGIIQSNGPVLLEIRNQLKSNNKTR